MSDPAVDARVVDALESHGNTQEAPHLCKRKRRGRGAIGALRESVRDVFDQNAVALGESERQPSLRGRLRLWCRHVVHFGFSGGVAGVAPDGGAGEGVAA